MSTHTLSVLVENSPGVLARVSSLFMRRGFNIESLAVGPTEIPEISRMTIVVNVDRLPLEQVTKQLNKLVQVLKIVELEPTNAVERELMTDGFVRRYTEDFIPDSREGAFLACSFWLADAYVLLGRVDDATALFERLLGLCNDVGLLSEEYDTHARRLIGNFPQGFSHIGLINTAFNLARAHGPARQRAERTAPEGV